MRVYITTSCIERLSFFGERQQNARPLTVYNPSEKEAVYVIVKKVDIVLFLLYTYINSESRSRVGDGGRVSIAVMASKSWFEQKRCLILPFTLARF